MGISIITPERLVQIIISLYVFFVWLYIWRHSFRLDRKIMAHRLKMGLQKDFLPFDRRLIRYTNTLIVLLFIFYTVFYQTLSAHVSLISSVQLYAQILAFVLIFVGAIFMTLARNGLGMLLSKEIIYSINKVHVSEGVYKYFHHPMYVGMLMIVSGALLLAPSLFGVFLVTLISICLVLKAMTEIKD